MGCIFFSSPSPGARSNSTLFLSQLFSFKGSKISLNRAWAHESLIHPPIFLQPSLPRSLYPTTDSTALRFSVCLSVNSSWLSGNAIDWSEFQISRPILSLVLSFSFSLVSNARARNVWSVSTTLVTNVIFGACSLPRI